MMRTSILSAFVLAVMAATGYAQPPPDGPAEPPFEPTPEVPKPDAKPATSLSKIDTKKIEQLFDEGTKHYDLGEWDQAIASFKQAYALMPDPSFLFNLGQAYKQKGACRDSKAAYVAYLRKAPDEDRAKVEGFIRELEPCVKIEEERARRLLPAPRLSPRHRKLRIAGLLTTGVGAALLGGAAYFTVRSYNLSNDVERDCKDGCTADDVLRRETRGERAGTTAKLLYAGGGAAVGVGLSLVLYTVFRAERVVVTPNNSGVVVGARVAF